MLLRMYILVRIANRYLLYYSISTIIDRNEPRKRLAVNSSGTSYKSLQPADPSLLMHLISFKKRQGTRTLALKFMFKPRAPHYQW